MLHLPTASGQCECHISWICLRGEKCQMTAIPCRMKRSSGKELGRDIRLQTRQASFGTSAAKPACRNQPNFTSESVRFSCLDNLLSRQKSHANTAGTADPKPHRLAAAHEEHIKVMHCMPQEQLGSHEQVHACRNTL
jgi:hypothetical protein